MFPLAGDINWMETEDLPERLYHSLAGEGFPLAGDINWMETPAARAGATPWGIGMFPLAGDINWMETAVCWPAVYW